MNYCRADLIPIESGYYSKKAAKNLFSTHTPPSSLPFTWAEFFREGPKHIQGMSISGVQQKLSLKLVNSKFEMVTTGGECCSA